tara:strand:- start:2915 stop:3994 length:1080 start_codon:yes stop_codon:yes gene_type:complete
VVTKVIRLEDFNPSSSGSFTTMSLAGSLFKLTSMMRTWRRDDDDVHGLDDLASAIAFIVQADALSVLLVDEENQVPQLVLRGNYGLAPVDVSLIRFQLGEGLAGQVWESKEAAMVNDVHKDDRFTPLYGQETSLGSMLLVPLLHEDVCLGVVCASRKEVRAFYDTDKETLAKVATSLAQDLSQGNYYKNAVTDSLTGLKNRFFLLEQLRQELFRIRRYQAAMSFALIDLDGLAQYNAAKGRALGDHILVALAARLHAGIRETDLLVRFGEDEFAVLFPMTDLSGAEECLLRLKNSLIDDPILLGPDAYPLSLSIGLSAWQESDEEPLDVLERADRALSHAKKMGGSQIVAADDSAIGYD